MNRSSRYVPQLQLELIFRPVLQQIWYRVLNKIPNICVSWVFKHYSYIKYMCVNWYSKYFMQLMSNNI